MTNEAIAAATVYPFELRPPCELPRRLADEHLLAPRCLERVALRVRVLIARGHASVADPRRQRRIANTRELYIAAYTAIVTRQAA
jgi:hypothetical protein